MPLFWIVLCVILSCDTTWSQFTLLCPSGCFVQQGGLDISDWCAPGTPCSDSINNSWYKCPSGSLYNGQNVADIRSVPSPCGCGQGMLCPGVCKGLWCCCGPSTSTTTTTTSTTESSTSVPIPSPTPPASCDLSPGNKLVRAARKCSPANCMDGTLSLAQCCADTFGNARQSCVKNANGRSAQQCARRLRACRGVGCDVYQATGCEQVVLGVKLGTY